eukprot:jgi/Mesen1/9547/ME000064S08890
MVVLQLVGQPAHTAARDVRAEFPLVQKKIVDFFRIEKPLGECPGWRKRRRANGGLTRAKKSRNLVPHRPSADPKRRLHQMASLATALTSLGASFCDELHYMEMVPRSLNRAAREPGGMQADDPIADLTIIAEYTGQVELLESRQREPCDAMMGLLSPGPSHMELVICPDRYANIARFISGINNHSRGARKKINVRSIRFDVSGEARALLVAVRDIRRGERLYYDYNGLDHDYPTHYFD